MKYSETPVKQEHAQELASRNLRGCQERDRVPRSGIYQKSFQFMVEENRLEAEVVRRRYRAEQQVPREPQVREDRSVRFEEPKERAQPHLNPSVHDRESEKPEVQARLTLMAETDVFRVPKNELEAGKLVA